MQPALRREHGPEAGAFVQSYRAWLGGRESLSGYGLHTYRRFNWWVQRRQWSRRDRAVDAAT
eukprot:scaffold105754_cov30-Phaeocystis_antarctica.AAC.1